MPQQSRPERGEAALRERLARAAGLGARDERLRAGRLTVHPRGFGFVRPDQGTQDLFLPPPIEGALDGDRVLVVAGDPAKLVGVLRRFRRRAAGTWDGRLGLRPDDPKLPSPLRATPGKTRARPGDKVVVSLESDPAVVVEVVGRADDPTVDERAALLEAEVRATFPREVLAEAERLNEPGTAECRHRMDLRAEVAVVTIDPVSARDFDDAVSVRRTADGWQLGVHIADVAAYVRPGTPLDREARLRGNSVYLPSRVVPMLPERLSNDLCSLREGRDRLTKSVLFDLDRDGRVQRFTLHSSVIRPFRRLTYERASAVMGGATGEHPDVTEALRAMRDLASLMGARRGDAIQLERPEVHFTYDAAGRIVSVEEGDHGQAHGVIEEFMLAANRAVAEYLGQSGQPALYRHHGAPASLVGFTEFTGRLGIPYHPQHSLASFMRKTAGRPEARLLTQELLWALPAAEYRPDRPDHFALGFERYLHFTSPIRRYADLVVQRAIDAALAAADGARGAGAGHGPEEDLAALGEHLSQRERLSAGVESRLRRRQVLTFLADRDRGPHQGVITGVQRDALRVELPRFLVWGRLPIAALPGRGYLVDEIAVQNEANLYRVGDVVHVRVAEIDQRTGQIAFSL